MLEQIGDQSPSKNGKVQSSSEDTANDEKSNNVHREVETSIKVTEHSDSSSDADTSSSFTNSTSAVTTSAPLGLFSTRNEGTKLNHSSSPLRQSVLSGAGVPSPVSSSSSSPYPSLFGSVTACSPSFSSPSGSFPRNLFARSNSSPRPIENRSLAFQKPVLRPSLLANPSMTGSPSKSSNPFVLKASKLVNPLTKPEKSADSSSSNFSTTVDDDSSKAAPESDQDTVTSSTSNTDICSTDDQDDDAVSPTAGQQGVPQQQLGCSAKSDATDRTHVSSQSVPFVPLGSSPAVATSSTSIRLSSSSSNPFLAKQSSTPGGFVFGQNLHERVVMEPAGTEPSTSRTSTDTEVSSAFTEVSSASVATAATNGTTSEMLFSSVIQKELPEKAQEGSPSVEDKSRKSLSESAREYEESRAVKRKYEEVAVITGEEEENNILQMDCKLFVYDGSKFNYSEGVHGSLRVNDPPVTAKKVTQSRVIVRMLGTLRVLMNTKIWAGMKIEKPNRKIVRMTAMDSVGQIKVFLISSNPSESDMLYRVLESRIRLQKELTGSYRNGSVDESEKPSSSG